MTVNRISRLRDCGVFRDFTWSSDLPHFGRYNLIYGWNGSGKTTISRILRALETRTPPANGKVVVSIDGRDTPGDEFAQATLPVRVFNHDFMAENVFPVGGGDLPPIFVLGKESVEKQKEVDRLKGEQSRAELNLTSMRSKKDGAASTFDNFCRDRAKIIKETLRSSGTNPYNNYDKSDYQRDTEHMVGKHDAARHRLDDAQRDRLLAQVRANPKPKVQKVTYVLPDFAALTANASELLSATVLSSAIEALRDDPSVSKWVREGLGLHRERNADRCLFCEQPLPPARLAALDTHFSAQYEQLLQCLDQAIAEIRGASRQSYDLSFPKSAELYDDLGAEYESAETVLREVVKAAQHFLDAVAQTLTDKKNRPFERVDFNVVAPAADSIAVDSLNKVIGKHNQACEEFRARVEEARKRLALDMIAADLSEFVSLREATHQAASNVQTAEHEVQRLTEEVERLEREIVEHRQPAEQVNDDLHKYLGHDELRLEIKHTGYAVTRHGVPALALSEGETTAIALLYFLKTLQDRRFDLPRGVVVLDDPVSSLDANALYLAFGLIRERAQGAGQLFILTHNFSFFSQVRNWFHYLNGKKQRDVSKHPARFFMLSCPYDENGRHATIRRLDPLLEHYESEYQYLFACVYRASTDTWPSSLEKNYMLPNAARRLLEAFLAFRQPQVSRSLWQKIQAVRFDEAKKLRILRFLNTHSHSNALGEPEHDPSILAECPAVLRDLMELISSQDAGHYSAMLQIVGRGTESPGGESQAAEK